MTTNAWANEQDPPNKFRVPKKSWGSWTVVGRHTFNKIYQYSMESREVYDAYNGKYGRIDIPDHQWRTIAWNFAFMAASVTSRGERHLIKNLKEKIK